MENSIKTRNYLFEYSREHLFCQIVVRCEGPTWAKSFSTSGKCAWQKYHSLHPQWTMFAQRNGESVKTTTVYRRAEKINRETMKNRHLAVFSIDATSELFSIVSQTIPAIIHNDRNKYRPRTFLLICNNNCKWVNIIIFTISRHMKHVF